MKCAECGKEELLPFTCPFCKQSYCLEHRLPENHTCPNAPPRIPLGSYESKQRLSGKAKKQKSKFVSEGDFHFVRKPKNEEKKNELEVALKQAEDGLWNKLRRKLGF